MKLEKSTDLTTSIIQRDTMDLSRSKARRRLNFDDPDDTQHHPPEFIHRQILNVRHTCIDYHLQRIKEETDRMSAKWNFDFKNDKPLDGDIKWYHENEKGWFGRRPSPYYVREGKLLYNTEDSVIVRKSKVRRRLFPEQEDLTPLAGKPLTDLQNSQNQDIEICSKDCQEKWNFDFKNEKPLDGPVRWRWCSTRMTWIGALPSTNKTQHTCNLSQNKTQMAENGNTSKFELEKVMEDDEEVETMQIEDQENENKIEEVKEGEIEENKEEIEMSNDFSGEIEEKLFPMEIQNQITPRNAKDDSAPIVRKRKRDIDIINEPGAKRRISFH